MAYLTTKSYTKSTISNKCFFCNGDHTCRVCPIESAMAPILKKKVGEMMEYWVGHNLKCPGCAQPALNVIGNHAPSLDIICQNCSNKIEVKSKCLSVNKLPNDINLPHGSYIDFTHRLDDGLNLIVIIYGVDRIKKLIKIREVLYADNAHFKNTNIIKVEKRSDSNLSTIFIKNREKLTKLKTDNDNMVMSFSDEYKYRRLSILSQ